MSKAAWAYLAMSVALVGGLWVVLAVGATLRAPPDLTGEGAWHIEWDGPAAGDALPTSLRFEQSGSYVTFVFAPAGGSEAVYVRSRLVRQAGGGPARYAMRGGGWGGAWAVSVPDYAPPPRAKAELAGSVGPPVGRKFVARWASATTRSVP